MTLIKQMFAARRPSTSSTDTEQKSDAFPERSNRTTGMPRSLSWLTRSSRPQIGARNTPRTLCCIKTSN